MDKQQVIDTYIEKNNKKSILGFLGINKFLGVDNAIKQYLNNENKPDLNSSEGLWSFLKGSIMINFFLKDKKNELDKLKEYLDVNKDNKIQLESLANEIRKGTEVEKAISNPAIQNQVTDTTKENIETTPRTETTPKTEPETKVVSETSPDITDKYIKSVIKSAEDKIWSSYKRWWVWPNAFDCSGLRYRAFQNEWIEFPQRFTAEYFSKKDVDINQKNTQIWDFMYREESPSQNKHNDIYHIEMIVDTPFQKDDKRFVKTIWSSTDDGVLDHDWNSTSKDGVGYRIREITEYRHFWRPSYYQQLAQHEKTWWDESGLLA